MIDFLAIRNSHLRVFEQYQQRKRHIAAPVLRGQVKLNGIKRLSVDLHRYTLSRSNFLPGELIGRHVNFWV